MSYKKLLKDLNSQQKEAVTHLKGPLLVIAGAGTGKTQIITHRIAYLIAEKYAEPHQILALTFTDKAANQMEERVDMLVPYGLVDVWISTFHSFGDRVLRENAFELGLTPEFDVLTPQQTEVFFREHLFEFSLKKYRPLGNPTKFIQALLAVFNRSRDEDTSPQEYIEFARQLSESSEREREEKERHLEIAYAYQKFMELQIRYGKIDFANQVYLTLQLFRTSPSVLHRYQESFKYILVDEFQDTNFVQLKLLELLAQKHQNIMVVCDDDQAIYRFRGAAFSNIINFMKTYSQARKISINTNYRSHQAILDTAYRLIQHNNPDRLEVQAGIRKKLVPSKKKKIIPVKFYYLEDVYSEADYVAELIKEKVSSGKYKYSDFAILVRSNSDAEPFLRSLNILGIPWRFSGNRGLYSQPEVRLCISFLKTIVNPWDSLSLHHLAQEFYKVDSLDLSFLTNYASRNNKELFYVFKNYQEIEELHQLKEDSEKKIGLIVRDIESYLNRASEESTGRLLYLWLTEKGIISQLVREASLENEQKLKNIARFFENIREFESLTYENKLNHFIQYLDLILEIGDFLEVQEAEPDIEAVNILTVHKAKGLEFRVVFIVSLVEGKFPWPKRVSLLEFPKELYKDILPQGDYHIQEERRLFYVALTRAQEEVILTSARDYGGKRQRKISRFVYEALDIPKELPPLKRKELIKHLETISRKREKVDFKPASSQEVLNLTFYHIDDYLTCPLKYKFIHILRIPIIQHHTVIYGNSLHKAVQRYNEAKKLGRKIELKELIEVFLASWRSEGFISREHENLRLQEGKNTLEKFYNRQEKEGRLPYQVEKSFQFVIDKVRIRGRWDRIDLEDGRAVIIDFKSSAIDSQDKADERASESLQLTLYAFAYLRSFGVLPEREELYFLESGLVGRTIKTDKDFQKLLPLIKKVEEGIRKGSFEPSPSYQACNYCAYHRVCPYTSLNLF